jgi:hypothetical protein
MTPVETDGRRTPPGGRREIKFVGPALNAEALVRALASCCRPDPQHPENVVHTVYFDTRGLASLAEKRNGDFIKTKVRLRWYVGPGAADAAAGPARAWLESKSREGPLGRKTRLQLEVPEGLLGQAGLDTGRLAEWLRHSVGDALLPSAWLRYRRRRMVFCDAVHRVAVDSDIAALWAPPALARGGRGGALAVMVAEVKGPDDAVPHPLLESLLGRFARRRAFSKYDACMRRLAGELADE